MSGAELLSVLRAELAFGADAVPVGNFTSGGWFVAPAIFP